MAAALDLSVCRIVTQWRNLFMSPNSDQNAVLNLPDGQSIELQMMFAVPAREYEPDPVVVDALNLLLILHADHEQNCPTAIDYVPIDRRS